MEVHHTVLYIFPMVLLRKKIVLQSTALCVRDHFLYCRDLNVLFSGTVGRNQVLNAPRGY